MDLHEWEILSNEAFVDLHEEDYDDQKVNNSMKKTTLIDMDYFHQLSRPKIKRGLSVIPVQIKLDQEEKLEEVEIPKEVIIKSSQESDDDDKDQNFDDQEMISKVFFKKLKENDQFVDMKMDSPMSLNRGIMPQIDVGTYQFVAKDEKDGNFEKESVEKDDKVVIYEEKKVKKDENEVVNIWKWAMTGMGALFTFGFTAATVTFIVFSNKHKQNHSKMQQLHFQIYSHDKRFKQVVRRAKKLNEAISVMRGAPMTMAHITIGGYNEAV